MGFKLGQDVGTIPQVSMMQYSDFTRNMTCLRVFAHTDTLRKLIHFLKSTHILQVVKIARLK